MRSPERMRRRSAGSSSPTEGRCFWTKWANCHSSCSRGSCGSCRRGKSNVWAALYAVDVDVRIIAATNRDLADEVREGQFRRDLFYRLNVFPITLPSLRDRRSDIPLLVRYLVSAGPGPRKRIEVIPPEVMRMLETYDWPGNVRELENVLQRAIILSHGTTLSLSEAWLPAREPMPIGEGVTLLEVERRHIVHVLNASCWRIEGSGGAAAVLG